MRKLTGICSFGARLPWVCLKDGTSASVGLDPLMFYTICKTVAVVQSLTAGLFTFISSVLTTCLMYNKDWPITPHVRGMREESTEHESCLQNDPSWE